MLRKLKQLKEIVKNWVISKTITHAESRFSIFVWMRQINDRILNLESKEVEAVIQQRAELEMFFEAKIQKLGARVGMLESQVNHLENQLGRALSAIADMEV